MENFDDTPAPVRKINLGDQGSGYIWVYNEGDPTNSLSLFLFYKFIDELIIFVIVCLIKWKYFCDVTHDDIDYDYLTYKETKLIEDQKDTQNTEILTQDARMGFIF